jgi:hypothetical protein
MWMDAGGFKTNVVPEGVIEALQASIPGHVHLLLERKPIDDFARKLKDNSMRTS